MKRIFNIDLVEMVTYDNQVLQNGKFIVTLHFVSGRVVNNTYDNEMEADNFYSQMKTAINSNLENKP